MYKIVAVKLNSAQDAVLYYILTYGLTTIGAFGVVSVVERATGSDKLDSFLGLHKRNPVLAAVLLVLFLSLAGIPPLVGFWAKFNLFAAVLNVGAGPVPFALVALAIAMSAVSLYYYLQVLKRAYVMPAADESPIKANPLTTLVLVAIAAAVVVMGCLPGAAAKLDRRLLSGNVTVGPATKAPCSHPLRVLCAKGGKPRMRVQAEGAGAFRPLNQALVFRTAFRPGAFFLLAHIPLYHPPHARQSHQRIGPAATSPRTPVFPSLRISPAPEQPIRAASSSTPPAPADE